MTGRPIAGTAACASPAERGTIAPDGLGGALVVVSVLSEYSESSIACGSLRCCARLTDQSRVRVEVGAYVREELIGQTGARLYEMLAMVEHREKVAR
jgi:hypothetical protein